jgi:O-antigen/teichoic acid export membrane protein
MISRTRSKIYQLSKKYGQKMGLDLPYFVKNGFWVIVRKFFDVTAGVLLSVVFARLASQEVYGQYQYILSIFGTVSILSIPGLNTSLIKSVAEERDGEYENIVKISFFWSFLGIPILFAIGAYYYLTASHSLGIALILASIFFPFFYAPNTWYNFLQGKKRFDVLAKFGAMQAVLNTIATIIVIFFYRNSLIAITLTYLVSYTFFNVFYYFKSLKYIENSARDAESISYGFFLTKLSVISTISANLDKILIGIFLSPVALAIYSVGMLFTSQIQAISKSFLLVVSVKAIRQKILTKEAYLKIFALGALATIIFMFCLKFIIPFLFSNKYADSIFLSEISMIFFPFYVINLLYSNEYTFGARKSILLKNSIIFPIVQILLISLTLPTFGIKGMAFLFGFYNLLSLLTLFVLNHLEKKPTAMSVS